MLAAELAKPPSTHGEILVFLHGKGPSKPEKALSLDAENQVQRRPVVAEKSEPPSRFDDKAVEHDVFHWEDLCHDIKVKGGTRRLLDHVNGWVKPGVSTILMVSSIPTLIRSCANDRFTRAYPVQGKQLCWMY